MSKLEFAAIAIAAAAFASGALAQQAPGKITGGVLTDGAGMTLYTYDKDTGGKSACSGPCAANWPPLTASSDGKASGEWSLIARDDGSKQWAFRGKPVYHWSKDKKPGDMAGDGFNGVWHVVKG